MVIDCHAHILSDEDGHLKEMLDAADRAGIDRVAISSLSREWVEFPSAGQLDGAAQDVLSACAKHPDRFIGAVYVSADHVDTSLALMDRCIANGPCRTLKLWVSQFADDPRLDPIVERAIELDVPILAHTWIKATGNMTKESTYCHAIHMACRHPAMKIWLAHCSGCWEEVGRGVLPYPNVCVDVSGGEPEAGMVERLVEDLGPERVFFGSDALGRNPVVQKAKVTGAAISDEDKQLILGDNFRRWIDA